MMVIYDAVISGLKTQTNSVKILHYAISIVSVEYCLIYHYEKNMLLTPLVNTGGYKVR